MHLEQPTELPTIVDVTPVVAIEVDAVDMANKLVPLLRSRGATDPMIARFIDGVVNGVVDSSRTQEQ